MASWSVQQSACQHVVRNSIGIFIAINQKFMVEIELVSSLVERNRHGRMFRLNMIGPIRIPDNQMYMLQLVEDKEQDHLLDEGVVLIHHHE